MHLAYLFLCTLFKTSEKSSKTRSKRAKLYQTREFSVISRSEDSAGTSSAGSSTDA